MALRPAREPLSTVPDTLEDGSRLVGICMGGAPIYHDADVGVLRDDGGSTKGDESHRRTIADDESVADAITAVERSRGWAVLSRYGLEHLSDQ